MCGLCAMCVAAYVWRQMQAVKLQRAVKDMHTCMHGHVDLQQQQHIAAYACMREASVFCQPHRSEACEQDEERLSRRSG